MIVTEKTKNKSYCCQKPIYIEKVGWKDGSISERPYCSGCLKFPPASPEAIQRVKHLVNTGQICDSGFDKWKEDKFFIKRDDNGKWYSPNERPEPISSPLIKSYGIKPLGINTCPEYTDQELYTKYKNEILLDKK